MGSVLREGWEVKSLKEIGATQTGNTPPTKEKDNYGNHIPFVKPAHFKIDGSIDSKDSALSEKGLKFARLFQKNSILMVCIGATIGKTGFSKIAVTSNQQINALTPTEEFEPRFFYYLFITNYFQKQILKNSAQATLPIINKSKWENILVSFPKERIEQQKIVAILDEAFCAIDKAKANAELNLQNAKELFESYLQRVFKNRGEGWEENIIKDVCTIKSGTTISTTLERTRGDVLYVKISDMNLAENKIEINTSARFVMSNEIKINQIIPEGATIFPKRGGAIATNKKRKIIKPTIVDLNTMAIIPSEKISKDYFYHWFKLIDLNDISNGTSIPQINNYSFNEISIPFPSLLTTQKTIVNKLDALSEQTKALEKIYQEKLRDLDELKKSILQKAFSGKLT